jgi:hypothetical protein
MNFDQIKEKKAQEVRFETIDGKLYWSIKYSDGSEDRDPKLAPFAISNNLEINKSRMEQFSKDKIREFNEGK